MTKRRPVLMRITTVPISLHLLLKGQFAYMREQGYDVCTVSAEGPEIPEVLKEGVEHYVLPFTRKITPIQDLQCLLQLIRLMRRLKPDVVHTHTPKAGLLGMMAARWCGVKVRMHTVAGLPLMEATGLKRTVLDATEKITYACATRVYPNSTGLKEFMLTVLKTDPSKVQIIGKGSSNGIDTTFFQRTPELEAQARQWREERGIGPSDVVFSFVGRVVRDKGIVELVEAFKALQIKRNAANSRLFLVLVGPFEQELDPLPPDVYEFLKTSPSIILPGFQKDVRPWIMGSDVFVFPSYREGFPNVVMQACLLGVACVVSDINGCNEIIERGRTGLIVPPKNVEMLGAAMEQLVDDPTKRQSFATAAREFVATHFDRRQVWSAIQREYERLRGNA
ncbi:glycosyltransferase family 4 protein [Chryseolinea lacunae]|uniref:Glycosyltransferase family 4 protein n=1 Tax=Chryseolinea lacunae TaxID=2801331 RepID=A0ABS1KXN2_9BACT|nr:glycosyltransferase family 4 protein [Chryseolinea lacunae]MBL0744017.1 glycosyltransferase family 4 protein [Chryseolinea lacunae]